jgi:hypothetical protein
MTDDNILDDLELELRMLPGVRAAGFDRHENVLFVQLHLAGDAQQQPEPMTATRIAARHAEGPVAVEIAHWRTRSPAVAAEPEPEPYVDLTLDVPIDVEIEADAESFVQALAEGRDAEATRETHRPRLLAVLVFPDTDELEVHLIHDGRRTIGRAPASRGLVGAVEATIEAVRGLGAPIDPRAKWARAIDSNGDGRELVAVALAQENEATTMQYGLAAGASAIDAAARSTLDALNRQLSRVL